MPLQSPKNLYPGINPHLNSFLQSDGGGWESFHAQFIATMARELDKYLPQQYATMLARSIQDVEHGGHDFPASVSIRKLDGTTPLGKEVTRIELLMPDSKPDQVFGEQYQQRRLELPRMGVTLVEIDFLHETPPLMEHHARDTRSFPSADPYRIHIYNACKAGMPYGSFSTFRFGVDIRCPKRPVPLADSERVEIDFKNVYNTTFESSRLFQLIVDYEREPERMETYTPADQARIRQRMKTIAENWE